MADRQLIVRVIGDSSSVEKAFLRSSKAASGFTAQITNTSRAIRNAFAAAGLAVGVTAAVDQIRKAVSASSDLEEQLNKSNVVFGPSAGVIQAWAETTAAAFGLSQRAALEAAGGFGQVLDTAGLTQDQASRFSRELVELAADIASFNNIDPTEALDKLRSGLVGEAEPLRRIGVLLSEARVKQEAYASGIAASGDELTEGQKVQARYALILRDTATAQGDFGRTSESLANQQRILAAQVENLRAKLGQAFLPAITGVVQGLNRWLASSENQQKVQETLTRAMDTTSRAAGAFQKVIQSIAPIVSGVVRGLGGLEKAVKLLAAAFIATKVARFTGALDAIGASAVTSTGKVNVLRAALLRLGLIAAIAIPITVVINRDEIDRKVNNFLRGHGLGFLASKKIELPVDTKAADLERFRTGLLKIGGASRDLIKELDKIIARQRILEATQINPPGEANRPSAPAAAAAAAAKSGKGFLDLLAAIDKVIDSTKAAVAPHLAHAAALVRLESASTAAALAVDTVSLALQRASATPTLADDIDAYKKIAAALAVQERAIRAQIALNKDDVGLKQELVTIQGQQIQNENALAAAARERQQNQRAAAREAIRAAVELATKQKEAAKAATQAKQFRALGLSGTGEELIPGVKSLKSRFAKIGEAVQGSVLDTSKLRSMFARIRALFAGEFGKITEESRRILDGIFDGLEDKLKQSGGPLTKTSGLNTKKIIEGLGLDAATAQEIRSRLSGFNSAGLALAGGGSFRAPAALGGAGLGAGIVVENHITLEVDGEALASKVTRSQQKARRRNPQQKRGPNRAGA